jgi:hypothetical protein
MVVLWLNQTIDPDVRAVGIIRIKIKMPRNTGKKRIPALTGVKRRFSTALTGGSSTGG